MATDTRTTEHAAATVGDALRSVGYSEAGVVDLVKSYAKQETLGEVRNLWPLAFLGAPLVYAVAGALESPTAAVLAVAFVLWVGIALWFLWRRQPGDVPRAVVSLIAGISLLDAVLIAGAGASSIAWLAVIGFGLTLALQRFVPGT